MSDFPSLLIIEDEAVFRGCLKMYLENKFSIYEAGLGEDAMKILSNDRIDIVMTDYSLPDINGDDLIEKIKSLYPHILVLCLTAYNDESIISSIKEKKVDKILNKPVSLKVILQTLQSMVPVASKS